MPEAWGQIIVRADDSLSDQLNDSDDSMSWDAAMALCQMAGTDPSKHKNFAMLVDEGIEFPFDESPSELGNGYWLLQIFGDEWMPLMQALVQSGKGVELYGSINSEYGVLEYYALQSNGQRYFGQIAVEEDYCSEESEEEVINKWLVAVPEDIRKLNPDLFDQTESVVSDESDEEDEPHEPWVPSADEDFVQPGRAEGVKLINESLLYDEGSYSVDHLRRAKELGAVLIDPYTGKGGKAHFCTVHFIIDNPELESAFKTRIVKDLLDIFEFDVDAVCKGYGDTWGTALFLAAGEGLIGIVELLLMRGASPLISEGNYLDELPLSRVYQMMSILKFEEPMEEEGEFLNYEAVKQRLEEFDYPETKKTGKRSHSGKICCPKCKWEAPEEPLWMCMCGHEWDTFSTGGVCPACNKKWKDTECISCGKTSPHSAWYQ